MCGGFNLIWPAHLKRTPTRIRWFEKFADLEPNLDLQQVSERLREPYQTVYRWAIVFAYPFPDRRLLGRVSGAQWDRVDWHLRDAEIAREFGISRERVRQVRLSRGAGPSIHREAIQRFEQWVRGRIDKLHGKAVGKIIVEFGDNLSKPAARRILRAADVKPHDPAARWSKVDWRLTNRDLAEIWNTSAKHVANVRARLGVGPPLWDGHNGRTREDPRYREALNRERKKSGGPAR
jgi:hypothetical protein